MSFSTVVDDYVLKLLRNEISTMKKLDHPNIVKLYEVCITNNNVYIMTEFCDSGDLSHLLRKKRYLNESIAIHILKNLIEGFKVLYKHGVLHRDLKPANIFIHQNLFKLGDFGFAKAFNSQETAMAMSLVGTPLYMSP